MQITAKGILGLLLWSQALFLASTFRSWWVVIAVATVATLAVMLRSLMASGDGVAAPAAADSNPANDRRSHPPEDERRSPGGIPRWFRWLLMTILFGIVVAFVSAWRIGSQVGEDINPIYLGVDIIAHASLFSSLLIWTFRPARGHLAMLPLGLVVVMLSVAAGGASVSLAAQTTVALAACLGFILGSQVILGSSSGVANWVLRNRDQRSDERSPWLAPIFSLLTLSVLMIITSAIANATNQILPAIQNSLQEQLQSSLESVGEQSSFGGTRYVRGSRLGAIRGHMLGNPKEIALRAHCEYSPGYLRGSAFDLYRAGRWMDAGSIEFSHFQELENLRDRQVLPTGEGTAKLKTKLNRPLQRFAILNEPPTQAIELEVHNEPLKGPVVFLPLSTYWMEAKSREILVTHHGVVRAGVNLTRPYVAGVGRELPSVQISSLTREITTDVPTSLEPIVKNVAESVCGSSLSTMEKANAISNYFQSEYGYSLGRVRSPKGVDPLSHFLTSKHDAHCEYFASATVMMLRSVGVPARYVTGYVADEPSEEDPEMWLARNLDAHAWVEAFDDESGRWFPVESTPGRTYQTVHPDMEEELDDSALSGLFDQSGGNNETLLGQLLTWLSSTRVSGPLLVLFRFAQFPLLFVLLFVLWSRYLKPARDSGNQDDLRSRKILRQVDKRLRKHALVRRPSETLYQFADRVDQAAELPSAPQKESVSETLTRSARWYRYFADRALSGAFAAANAIAWGF